jgi:hypothetical protein
VADGFEVNLWAADPLLAKPTQIAFDHQGRLWVSSSKTYPQLNVNEDANDQIIILEDLDQDGTADKSTVFMMNSLFREEYYRMEMVGLMWLMRMN